MGNRYGTWTRSKLTAALSVALVVIAGSFAGPSIAQETNDETTGVEFSNGRAKATAILAKVAPGVGGLELGATAGVSVAETTNALAQSQAQGADLGLVGTSLTAEGCDGDSTVQPEDLPQPIRVDNRQGNASDAADEIPLGPIGALRMAVEATTVPSSRAASRGVGLEIPGLLDLAGGAAIAETEVLDGAGREARAIVQTSLDLGGAITLRGLRWEARHRTGAERLVEGTFELAGADIGGVPLPIGDLEPVQAAINTALEFTGVTLELPRVEKLTEPTDLVRVTPLRISIKDSPAGATLLGPALNASREQREELFRQLAEEICDIKGTLLVADIGIAIAAGSGFLTIEIGGVEALSSEFEVGGAITVPSGAVPVAGSSGGPVVEPATPPPPQPVAATPDGVAAPAPATQERAVPVAEMGPLEEICETVHPFEWPSCSEGAAPAAGIIGLLATGAMVGLDYRRQRRGLALATGGTA